MNYRRITDKIPHNAFLKKALKEIKFLKKSLLYRKFLDLLVKQRIRGYERCPDIVLIENTNHCNAKCVMCPHSGKFDRAKGIMNFELFKKIINEMAALNIQRLQITGTGEPMLDNDLSGKITHAKQKRIEEVNIFANGSLLTKELGNKIIDSGLDLITFSFDGIERDEFEKIRVGLKYDEVTQNILNFLKLKRKKKRVKPFTIINSLVMKKKHAYFKLPLIKEIKSLTDRWNLYQFAEETHLWGGEVDISSSDNPQTNNINTPCRRLWTAFNILWDGKVVPCCMDYEGRYNLKNIAQESLLDIWLSSRYEKFRQIHLEKRIFELEMCRKCSERLSWLPEKCGRMMDSI